MAQKNPQKTKSFIRNHVSVPRDFRDIVLRRYSNLSNHPNAKAYRRMAQHILFSSFSDEDTKELVLPCEVIAYLVGETLTSHRFNALAWIKSFSEDVFPLHDLGYSYSNGRARTVRPEIDDAIICAKLAIPGSSSPRVSFESGCAIPRRTRQENAAVREDCLRSAAQEYLDSLSPEHPVYSMADYLNSTHGNQVKIQNSNWHKIEAKIFALPEKSEKDIRIKDSCIRLLGDLDGAQRLFYKGSDDTPRLSTIGASIHQFPRDIRKLVLSGPNTWEFDLKAAQLAIVAHQWKIPRLQECLEKSIDNGPSIWGILADAAGIPLYQCKGDLKATVYSIVFGMHTRKVQRQLANGDEAEGIEGIGEEAARRVLGHPLMRDLLEARDYRMWLIDLEDGAVDAWGVWRGVRWDSRKLRYDIPSVLAYCVQSWEVKIMLSLLPVLKAEKQIYPLSWLHDGVTLYLGNSSKVEEFKNRITKAVNKAASDYSFATMLEAKRLEAVDLHVI